MLTQEEDMEASALRKRGWSISAIARYLGRDRKTVRAYLSGERRPGERRPGVSDNFAPYEPYVRERLGEDPHLWATALYDELRALGYARSYQVLTRELRRRGLRPHCEACAGTRGRATIEIDHPPGEKIQWDWLELPDGPWADEAHLLVGTLSHSGNAGRSFANPRIRRILSRESTRCFGASGARPNVGGPTAVNGVRPGLGPCA